MGSSLWQWSSGHKSKRAHKHHKTDGWEDSSGQGGRDGEREMKWDREEREKDRGGREISGWIVKSYEKSQVLDGLWMPCSMSAVKGKTRNHRGNSLPLMSNRNTTSEWSQDWVNTCQNIFLLLLQELLCEINICSFNWELKRQHYIGFGQLLGWKVYPPGWHKNGWKRYWLNIKAEHREKKVALEKQGWEIVEETSSEFQACSAHVSEGFIKRMSGTTPTLKSLTDKHGILEELAWGAWCFSINYSLCSVEWGESLRNNYGGDSNDRMREPGCVKIRGGEGVERCHRSDCRACCRSP